jgi:PilZ domain-containing protein
MSLLHFRYKERRRTVRVALSVPLTIHGKFEGGEKFCVQTHSQSVNRHGALFPLETPVTMGQTLLLVNDITAQGTECRVVAVRRGRDGKTYIGVEFANAEGNFWHMVFPVPGTRPLRRPIPPSKASANLA